jgi:hypothetical protein
VAIQQRSGWIAGRSWDKYGGQVAILRDPWHEGKSELGGVTFRVTRNAPDFDLAEHFLKVHFAVQAFAR